MIHAETAPTEQACIRIARSQNELLQAFSLVYHSYLDAGLIKPNQAQVRVLPQHALSTSEVFVVKVRNQVLGTATLIRDSELGLPLEAIYKSEIADRRDQHLSLSEVSCLADCKSGISRRSLIELMAFTAQCAKLRGVDQILIAVHPRHVKFYVNLIGFNVFGGLRTYSAVRGHPAIGLILDLGTLETRSPKAHERLFGKWHSGERLAYQPFATNVRRYVENLIQEIDPNSVDSSQLASLAS